MIDEIYFLNLFCNYNININLLCTFLIKIFLFGIKIIFFIVNNSLCFIAEK